MISDRCLYFAGLFVTFSLQITAAYIACSLVNRTLIRPRQRFRVWTAFLAGSAIYWIGLVAWNLRLLSAPAVAGNVTAAASMSSSLFVLPLSWSPAVLTVSKILVFAYVATVIVLLSVNGGRQMRLWMVLRQGWAPPEPIRSLFDEIRCDLGVSRCRLLVMPGLSSPATAGWLRPRVLIPVVCEELGPTSRLADVLHHELAHVARRDYFWAGFSDLICRVLFFHPAVWRAGKLARFQGELACDLAVVEARPERRVDYADSLAYFVRLRMIEEQAPLGIDFAASASTLGTRIRFILAGSPAQPWWKRIPRNAAALALAGAFAVAAPALTVSFGFFQPLSNNAVSQQLPTPVAPSRHRAAVSNSQAKLPPVTDLNKLRVAGSSSDIASRSLTGGGPGSGRDSSEFDRPWRESASSQNRPSVASVVRSTVGAIVVARGGDHDHDHDHSGAHLLPQ
jgi:beta-lactamase regulating signal transducer with metallopeptidase domain